MLMKTLRKEKGVTLLEVLAVVIIGILIMVGSFFLYNKINNTSKDNQVMSSIMSIKLDIHNIYGNERNFGTSGDIAPTFNSIDIIPSFFKKSNGDLVSPYDPNKTITFNVVGDNNHLLEIGIEGVPTESCIRLSRRSEGYRAVGINSVDIESNKGTISNNPTPIVASEACSGDDVIYYLIGTYN